MFPLRRQRGEYRANGSSSFSRAEPVPKVRAGHGPVQMLAVYIWRLFRCPAKCVQYRSMPIHSSDWRSYDQTAKDYDRVWATRFARVARGMADMMPAGCAPRVLLDIGTGTGIVPEVFAEIFRTLDVFAGCDISLGMLQQAKTRLANLPGGHRAEITAAAVASNTRLCKRSSQRQARRRTAGTTRGFRNTNPRAETLRKSQPVVRLPRQD